MTFVTDSYADIIKSLAILFEVTETGIEKLIKENPDSLKKKFDTVCKRIEKVSFYHLTRRLDGDEDSYDGRNLVEVLTGDTALKKYLQNRGLSFVYKNGIIHVFKEGEEIELIEDLSDGFLNIPYLKGRLGVQEDIKDFCINGFLFGDNLKNNIYYRPLSMGPEILFQLAHLVKDLEIYYEFCKSSTYYIFKYEIPIQEVIFDDFGKLNNEEKQLLVLRESIKRIAEYDDRKIVDDNVVLRMPDYEKIPEQYFVSKTICGE